MPPKRRRFSINAKTTPIKKIKAEVRAPPDPAELKSFALSTIQLVSNLRDDTNRIIAKEFYKLPSKKLYPDYYEEIESPIAINDMKQKATSGKYITASDLAADFELMYNNAVTYNTESSLIAQDCKSLLDFVQDQVKQFDGKESTTTVEEVSKEQEPVKEEEQEEEVSEDEGYIPNLKHILTLCINHKPYKRPKISKPFMDEVDRDEYPDYYKVIKKPMSFNKLLDNLPTYKTDLRAFLDDINLIWQNAQTYNDEDSLLYQDSLKLCDFFYKHFAEFVANENIDINYEVPKRVSKEELKPVETPVPEKKKRGRPRLSSLPPKEPLPIHFSDDEKDMDVDEAAHLLAQQQAHSFNNGTEMEKEEELPLEPISLKKLNVSKYIGYKRPTQKYKNPKFNNFIKYIDVSATKNLYKKSHLQESEVGKFIASLEKTKPVLERFFAPSFSQSYEYHFNGDDLHGTNYSLKMKYVNFIQVATMLNLAKIGSQKFDQALFFNGERINASPSIYEYDDTDSENDDKLSLSKYDIALLPGLNSLEFVCKVGPIVLVDENGKLPSRHATNPNNENNYVTERCCIWITCDQY